MKNTELLTKNENELKEMLAKLKTDLQKTLMDVLQKKEKNVRKSGLIKKDIARVKTVMALKEIQNA